MVMMMIFVGAPVLLLTAASALAIGATIGQRRGQAANDHDTPLFTPLCRARMRWAAVLLALASVLLIVGRLMR